MVESAAYEKEGRKEERKKENWKTALRYGKTEMQIAKQSLLLTRLTPFVLMMKHTCMIGQLARFFDYKIVDMLIERDHLQVVGSD